MRMLVTILFALVLSGLAGGVAAIAIADWLRGDETFVLVFVAILPAALVSLVFFLIAATRADPASAIKRSGSWLVVGFALLFLAVSLLEIGTTGSLQVAVPGVLLMAALLVTCLSVVIAQWMIFWFRRRAPSPAMAPRFGRQPQ